MARNQHQMSQKTYQRSKQQCCQNWKFMIMNYLPCQCKINFGYKIFSCLLIFKIFAVHITTNLVPNIVRKLFASLIIRAGCRISEWWGSFWTILSKNVTFLNIHQNPHENEVILTKRGLWATHWTPSGSASDYLRKFIPKSQNQHNT